MAFLRVLLVAALAAFTGAALANAQWNDGQFHSEREAQPCGLLCGKFQLAFVNDAFKGVTRGWWVLNSFSGNIRYCRLEVEQGEFVPPSLPCTSMDTRAQGDGAMIPMYNKPVYQLTVLPTTFADDSAHGTRLNVSIFNSATGMNWLCTYLVAPPHQGVTSGAVFKCEGVNTPKAAEEELKFPKEDILDTPQ